MTKLDLLLLMSFHNYTYDWKKIVKFRFFNQPLIHKSFLSPFTFFLLRVCEGWMYMYSLVTLGDRIHSHNPQWFIDILHPDRLAVHTLWHHIRHPLITGDIAGPTRYVLSPLVRRWTIIRLIFIGVSGDDGGVDASSLKGVLVSYVTLLTDTAFLPGSWR